MDMTVRPRRLRGSEVLRKMVRETRMDKSSLIYPMFVQEGLNVEEPIPSMEGQYRYSIDRMMFELERLECPALCCLGFQTIKMKWEAALMMKRESCRKLCGRQKRDFLIFIM